MFNKRVKIKELLTWEPQNQQVTVMGWVRTFRNNQFVALNDGSTNTNLQVVLELGKYDEELLKRITTSASLKVTGELIQSLGKGQKMEVKATDVEILGDSDPEKYPLQLKNRPTLEYLREKAHMRFRTNTFGSVFRVRHSLAFAIHKFFNDKGFIYLHTPIITASDAEGAGEMFRVSTLPFDNPPRTATGTIDFREDFFGRATNLTVSGQLEGELGATAFGDIYTFGPTFRAENSNTARHLAEFWMIEPEMAFYDLEDNMNLAEEFIKYIIRYAMDNNREDLEFLAQRLAEEEKQKPQQERSEMGLIEKLEFVLNNKFERVTYTEAIDILKESNQNSAFFGVLGNAITSRIFVMPVTNCTILSNPNPKPACGTVPNFLVSRYHHNSSAGIFISFIRCSNLSNRSSRCDPPTISPIPGARMSIAATVFPSSFCRI